ncbi:isoprenoid synthase domain-containing protein [Geopyxis carbonaria]|nr:isoprenoid synthase domain-containing protein [Geopyxis carbonaria]
MPISTTYTQQDQALDLIRGQTVLLPNFDTLLSGWKREHIKAGDCNPQVLEELNTWIQSFAEGSDARRLRACNFLLLSSSLWPTPATPGANLALAKASAWVFAWDDIFDEKLSNPKALVSLQADTKSYITALLSSNTPCTTAAAVPPINAAFSSISTALREAASPDVCGRFLESVCGYIDSVNGWNDRCSNGSMPSFEEYHQHRWLSSGIKPGIALTEYAYGLSIPAEIMDGPNMRVVVERTVEISMLLNDIVSVGREVETGQLSNVVPVLAYQNNTGAQAAMDQAVALIGEAQRDLEDAERRLLQSGNTDVGRLVEGCKTLCTGYLNWSHQSMRYFGSRIKQDGGRIVVQL